MKTIESKENPHFKAWKKLSDSARGRRKTGKIFLEGAHAIQMFSAKFGKVEALIFQKNLAFTVENRELCKFADEIFEIPENLCRFLTNLDSPPAVFAVANLPQNTAKIDFQKNTVLLDGIQNPLNLGAILRVAAAANFSQILISENAAHVFSPKSLRAAQGANFALDIFENADLGDFVEKFQGQIFAADVGENAQNLFSLTLENAPAAWIFGAEGQGVSESLLKKAKIVKIPMAGGVESLNVASAAALCLFEVYRRFC